MDFGKIRRPLRGALAVAIGLSVATPAFSQDPATLDRSHFRAFVAELLPASVDPATASEKIREIVSRYNDVVDAVILSKDLEGLAKSAGLIDEELGNFQESISRMNARLDAKKTGLKNWAGLKVYDATQHTTRRLGSALEGTFGKWNARLAERHPWLARLSSAAESSAHKLGISVERNWAKRLSAQDLAELGQEMREFLGGIQLTDSAVIRELAAFPTEEGKQDNEKTIALLKAYFARLPLPRRARIATQLLTLPPLSPLIDRAVAIFSSAGPLPAKALQKLGKRSTSEVIREVSRRFNANAPTLPFGPIRKVLVDDLATLGLTFDQVFSEFNEDPLKAGTVAQTYVARLRATNEEAVVKVQRPDVEEDFKEDFGILEDIERHEPLHRDAINDLRPSFMRENDFLEEAKAAEKGSELTARRLGVNVVKIARGAPNTRRVLIMKRAPGEPLSDLKLSKPTPDKPGGLTDDQLRALKREMEKLARAWFEVGILSPDGILHGDPHGGNILVHFQGNKPTLTLIDFGNWSQASLTDRRHLLELGAVAKERNPSPEAIERLLSHFGGLPPYESAKRDELRQGISDFLRDKRPLEWRLGSLLKVAKATMAISVPPLGFNSRSETSPTDRQNLLDLEAVAREQNPSVAAVEGVLTKLGGLPAPGSEKSEELRTGITDYLSDKGPMEMRLRSLLYVAKATMEMRLPPILVELRSAMTSLRDAVDPLNEELKKRHLGSIDLQGILENSGIEHAVKTLLDGPFARPGTITTEMMLNRAEAAIRDPEEGLRLAGKFVGCLLNKAFGL